MTASVVPRGGHTNKENDEVLLPTLIASSRNKDKDAGTKSKEAAFDTAAMSAWLRRKEVAKIKKSQLFLKKQQRRREMDTTLLDRGITVIIEFWENVFQWEVVDVWQKM